MGPFEHEHADAWATRIADVESLNARVSDHILRAIDTVRSTSRSDPRSMRAHVMLALGPAGAGKTHLFTRLRRRLGPRATFVLARPELGGDPTPRHVLTWVMDALQQPVPGREERQLDLVVGSALARLEGHGVQWPSVFLDELRSASPEERATRLGEVVERIGDVFPDADLAWLERLMGVPTLRAAERRAALVWLAGREPDESQLARLGLKEKLPDASVLGALRTLAFVASYSTPLVVVFDQLENLVEEEDAQDRRIHAHARLVSELFDTVRGLVIVQLALDAEWQRRIQPRLGASERSRLEARVELLELPTAAERALLVDAWSAGADARDRPWPFTDAEWAEWQAVPGLTPRALMIACRRASERTSPEDEPVRPFPDADVSEEDRDAAKDDRLATLWVEQLARSEHEAAQAHERGHPVDADRLRAALYVAIRHVEGRDVQLGRARQGFELRVSEGRASLDLWALQHAHPRAVSAALDKIIAALGERPSVTVRQQAWPLPPTWTKVIERMTELVARPGAIVLELDDREVARLLALHDLSVAARSRDLAGVDGAPLDPSEVDAWVRGALRPETWPVGCAVAAALGARSTEDVAQGEPPPPATRAAPSPRASGSPPPTRSSSPAAPSTPPRRVARPTKAPKPPMSAPERTLDAAAGASDAPAPSTELVREILARLCLASLDRLTADARMREPTLTRADVRARLRALGSDVRWLGRSIVAWRAPGR